MGALAAAGLVSICASAAGAAIVGVDIEAGQGSPTNWTSYTFADVDTTKSNLVDETGATTSVSFLLSGVTATQDLAPFSPSVIPSHTTDLTTVCCDVLGLGPNPTVALWSGLVPSATYNYWVFTSSAAQDTITATGATTDSFFSPAVSAESQAINGVIGSSALTFASYARQVDASAAGTIRIDIQSTGTPTPSGYAVELVDIPPIPVPAALPLFATAFAGLAGLAALRRRA